ncbi:MAG TPA: holliday junction resolvasome, helicase subunit [Pseudomonas sp.]|nr:holliday junction resolvasome, helicase subunit [Pseudomonas sp.]
MTRTHLLGAALLLALASTAQATSFVVTTDSVVGAVAASTDATSDVTSSFRDDKVVRAARDDAASFVASNGDIRGVKLESAFAHIRQQVPTLQASDAQLAQAILAL